MKTGALDAGLSGFIGIDWSGAKGGRQPGIQIAHAAPGRAVPQKISPPTHKYWGRDDVFAFLVDSAKQALRNGAGPALAGIDFAFAHPFHDVASYYPGLDDAPTSPAELWAMIDHICRDDPHFYGGAMFAAPRFADYYLSPAHHNAPLYQSRRRFCEHAARKVGRSPSPTFKAIGADNVATGSMAGMRLLHALRVTLGDGVKIWPFDWSTDLSSAGSSHGNAGENIRQNKAQKNNDLSQCGLILTEIFPSLYFHAAGFNPAKGAARNPAFMSGALRAYDSDGVAANFVPTGPDADEADALIAAAALRFHARNPAKWRAPSEAAIEGWIFGV